MEEKQFISARTIWFERLGITGGSSSRRHRIGADYNWSPSSFRRKFLFDEKNFRLFFVRLVFPRTFCLFIFPSLFFGIVFLNLRETLKEKTSQKTSLKKRNRFEKKTSSRETSLKKTIFEEQSLISPN